MRRDAKTPTGRVHGKSIAKRKKCVEKERERNKEIKRQLELLQQYLPGVESGLPKVRILRLTKEYILHLQRVLNGEDVSHTDYRIFSS